MRLGTWLMLLCGLVLLAASGCVEPWPAVEPLPGAEPEPVTLRVVARGGFALDGDYVKSLVPLFNERYPHITIEFAPPLAPDPETGCANANYCSQPGDVDLFWLTTSQAYKFKERGYLLDLDGLINADKTFDASDFLPGALTAYKVDGHQMALPLGMTFSVIVYNKDLFDRYDVAYPALDWTLDDFRDKAQALTHPAQDVWGYGAGWGWFTWLATHGGSLVDYDTHPPKTQFDDPRVIETLTWYADLIHTYHVAPTDLEARESISQGNSRQNIISVGVMKEQIAMWDYNVQGRRTIVASNLYWPDRWAMAPLPQTEESVTEIRSLGYGISAASKHPEAAWAWLTFISEQPPAPTGHALPVRRSILTSDAYINGQGEDIVDLVLYVVEGPTSYRECRHNCLPASIAAEAGPILSQVTQSVLAGDADAASALSTAQQEVERTIGK
jgi:multiple sugar transport system substrate-binding protein